MADAGIGSRERTRTRARRPLTVLGGYGGVNSGDEMILRAIVRQARRAGHAGPINIVCGPSPSPEAAARDYQAHDLRIASWRSIVGAARAAIGRDLFIGGGQIIDGVAGVQYPLVQLGLAAIARATGGRVTIGGVSTARLDRAGVRRAYAQLFRCAHRIVPRDAASADDILTIAPSARAKVETRADLVFALADELRGDLAVAERRTIVFAVHHSPTLRFTRFEETLAFLNRLRGLAPPEHEIVIVAHDMRPDWDVGLAERLAGAMDGGPAEMRTLATTEACTAFYRQARTVISARMHPVILGACAGAYCVPLSGSRKITDMAERLGVPAWEPATLGSLSDEEFRDAVGLGTSGPAADPVRLDLLVREAQQVIRPD